MKILNSTNDFLLKFSCCYTFIKHIKHHSMEECEFVETKCQYSGCQQRFERRQLQNHQQACEHKEIECQHCKKTIKALMEKVWVVMSF